MPNSIVLSERTKLDPAYRTVVAVADLPSGIVKKDQEVLAYHKMRILILVGGTDVYEYYDIDSNLFDQYFRPVLPSDPIIVPVQ